MSSQSFAILVVDRDPLVSQPLIELLHTLGHAASSVSTIEQGLRLIDKVKFDVAVISITRQSPVTDWASLQMAKAKYPSVKFIALSASEEASSVPLQVLDGFLHKPFTLEQLEASIRP